MTATFCERCGARQEFRAPRSVGPIRKTKGFIGGLKNYIGGSDALSEAMREGMQAQESAVAAAQLDAFHASIHLCIDCRQYTCNDCWNGDAGRCRSCAPLVGIDDLADRIAASLDGTAAAAEPTAVAVFAHDTGAPLAADSWPQADHEVFPAGTMARDDGTYELAVLPPDPAFNEALPQEPTEVAALADEPTADVEPQPAPPPAPEPEPDWMPEPEPEPIAAEAAGEDEPAPATAPASDAAAIGEAPPPLRVVAWETDEAPLDVVADAAPYAGDVAAEPEPLPAAATITAPETWDEEPFTADLAREEAPEPFDDELYAHEPAPAPAEPVAAEQDEAAATSVPAAAPDVGPTPAAAPVPPMPRRSRPMRDRVVRLPTPPAAPARRPMRVAADADDREVAARRAQLELLGLDDLGQGPEAAPDPGAVAYRSRGAVSNRGAASAAIREGALLWEASAREVSAVGVTVQSCDGCGLALSANARFCRRCGTRQAQSA
jgi:hypothetical protein